MKPMEVLNYESTAQVAHFSVTSITEDLCQSKMLLSSLFSEVRLRHWAYSF